MQGSFLNYGCTMHDYTIRIGASYCEPVELLQNQITCRPPKDKPPSLNGITYNEMPQVQARLSKSKLQGQDFAQVFE